ncbi:hypothetical protein NMY22_g18843 [Coprinellus aureogranulatus]|nr:hypothetical protein NMY22_g18843 [Coprinellus aureogranulatus]
MAPYDEWNKIDEEDDEELQDTSLYEGKRDVILFAIDCSESMLELYDHPEYRDMKTCHLYTALEAAMQIEKRKIIAGPRDSVGIMLFNTTRKNEGVGYASEIKKGTYLFQPISLLSAPKVQEIIRLLDDAREDPSQLGTQFPPTESRVPMGDVFTSCNWILRDGAPKTATKRVFLITDEDNPHPKSGSGQLVTSARTTLIDLTQAGVTVEPFFISTETKPFDTSKFYSSVLLPTNLAVDDEEGDGTVLPESISITRIEDLLAQMRFHEVPKRALFTAPLKLGEGFTIGVKGYGLVTEQKKGSYLYFVDLGDRMEVAKSRTLYVDELREEEVDKAKIVYGASGGASAAAANADEDDGDGEENGAAIRKVKAGQRPFYTPEEIRSFRTMGLETGIKLLGFKDRSELRFEDNVKHSSFLYPDEMAYSGSKRTFSALLKSMIRKKKVGLALALTRRNASPMFCYLLPQEENFDEGGWAVDPPGFHIIPIPFADDIRAAPVEEGHLASEGLVTAAKELVNVDELQVPTPLKLEPCLALAFHNAQLEAAAFREEFHPDEFQDLTEPNSKAIHKKAGEAMKEWKKALLEEEASDIVDTAVAGTKRKADVSVDEAEFRSRWQDGYFHGILFALRIQYRVDQLKVEKSLTSSWISLTQATCSIGILEIQEPVRLWKEGRADRTRRPVVQNPLIPFFDFAIAAKDYEKHEGGEHFVANSRQRTLSISCHPEILRADGTCTVISRRNTVRASGLSSYGEYKLYIVKERPTPEDDLFVHHAHLVLGLDIAGTPSVEAVPGWAGSRVNLAVPLDPTQSEIRESGQFSDNSSSTHISALRFPLAPQACAQGAVSCCSPC